MTEIVGYDGPILMTAPTRAIVPYMLEDFRRVMVETREPKDKEKEKEKEKEKDMKDEKEIETKTKGIFYTAD
jgi:predicted metal-dependent RNase